MFWFCVWWFCLFIFSSLLSGLLLLVVSFGVGGYFVCVCCAGGGGVAVNQTEIFLFMPSLMIATHTIHQFRSLISSTQAFLLNLHALPRIRNILKYFKYLTNTKQMHLSCREKLFIFLLYSDLLMRN